MHLSDNILTMESITYPIRCVNKYHVEATTDQVFEWLVERTRVHFIYEDHILKCTDPGFPMMSFGDHPTIKFIFINKDIELSVNALVAVFNANFPEQEHIDNNGGPTAVGDCRCPLCGQI